MEHEYIVKLVKYAVDKAYAGDTGAYVRAQKVLAIRGVSRKEFEEMEELYYYGKL
jgi:hypothetical protein